MSTLELQHEDVRVVTNDVWTSFLASYEDLEWATGSLAGTGVLSASVAIRGAWSGVVSLEMAPETAEVAARTMLRTDAVEAEEVSDALGELVNMIGGNIKSLLPSGSTLGLPMVTLVPEDPTASGVTEHCCVELAWAGTSIRVRVWSDPTEKEVNSP